MDLQLVVDEIRIILEGRVFKHDNTHSTIAYSSSGDLTVVGGFVSSKYVKEIETMIFEKQSKELYAKELQRYIAESKNNLSANRLAQLIGVDRSYIYKMINAKKYPSRDIAIMISIVLELDLLNTQKMLNLLGFTLSEVIKRDFVIMECIKRRLELDQVYYVLEEFQLETLHTKI